MQELFKKYGNITIIVSIILLLASSRLLKHPFNFTPIAAMALFSGCYLKKYIWIFLPILALLISDFFIGFYDIKLMSFVYLSFILTFLLGHFYSKHKKWYNLIFISLSSSIIFFLLTNFSVWMFSSWYPQTYNGLKDCFIMAIPFFKNTIVGDLIYSLVFFGVFEFAIASIFKEQKLAVLTR